MTNSVTLTSLALLKARYDLQQQDVLDSFICFIEVSLARRSPSHFSPEELKEWLNGDFGLDLPLPPLKLMLSRMSKRGSIKRSEKLYQLAEMKCNLKDFDKNQAELTVHYRAIVLSLKDYAHDQLGQDLTEAECEAGLLNYVDEYCIECVASFASGSVVPVRGSEPKHWRFIVSRFANHIYSRAPDLLEYFLTVLTGRMLANVLLASDLSALGAKFRRTSIYVDTPLLLQVIGVVGKEAQGYSREIFRLFTDAGARLRVFSHTMEETDQVLKNAERYLEMPSGGSGNVILALRDAGMSPSDVVLIRSRIQDLLLDEGLEIEETPRYGEKYQIDEAALEREMEDANLHYRSQRAKRADINSVRSAYVLRAGSSPERVEDSIALVLTNNAALAKAAYAYGRKHREFRHVSPVVTDFSLANIVWIKSPLKHPNIPMHLLLAHCYSALKPSEDLWNRFVDELKKLREAGKITPAQHEYLRYELRVRDELMNLTLGDEEQVSEEVVVEILGRHEEEITLPLKRQLEEIGTDHRKALQRLTDSERSVADIDNALRKLAHYVRVMVRAGLILIAIALLAYAYHPFLGTGATSPILRVVSGFLGFLLIVLNIAKQIFGFRIIDPVNRFSSLLEAWLLENLRRVLGLEKK